MRACRETQVNDVIGLAKRGHHAEIVFDIGDPMGESTCVACGECVAACPTGALSDSTGAHMLKADRKVDSVCPYCGVGCLLSYHVKDDKIIRVEGRDGPANFSRLCVKGRYGFDYVNHPQRLTKPLIRKDGVAKGLNEHFDPSDPSKMFREASWEEAMELAVGGLDKIRQELGGAGLAGFGSAKGSNEEAYLFQKLVRTGFGTNNVDHCTRLCHASSVAALLEGIGSGAVSNQVEDVKHAEVFMVIGSNPTTNHPVAATFMKNAIRDGKKLILLDPRKTQIARYATPPSAVQRVYRRDAVELDAARHHRRRFDRREVHRRTHHRFEELKANVADYSPEKTASVCGIDPQTLREVARLFATSKGSMIFWGMGISQHIHGTDNSRCLIALSMITGQVGRPGTGLHPLRGQNNVQGASDAGLIPMVFRTTNASTNPKAHQWFSEFWNAEARRQTRPHRGRDHARGAGRQDSRHVHHGREPGDVGPEPESCARGPGRARSPGGTGHVPDRDGGVCRRRAAGLGLGGERRHRLQHRPPRPAGQGRSCRCPARHARTCGLFATSARGWAWTGITSTSPRSTTRCARSMPSHRPTLPGTGSPGIVIGDLPLCRCERSRAGRSCSSRISRPRSGRGKLVAAKPIAPPDEQPDDEYPMILTTGRQLEHWHTGSMTRRTSVLDAIEPVPVIYVNSEDLGNLGVEPGGEIVASTRRGEIRAYARPDDALKRGEVFIPFCYHEAAANLLTNEALDPFGKIPEFKFCAIRLEAA